MNSKQPKRRSLPNLVDGSDAEFRELIALLYGVGRLQAMRRELAKALSVSIAEFSVLTALMYLERHETRPRGTVADHLRVRVPRSRPLCASWEATDGLIRKPIPMIAARSRFRSPAARAKN